MKSSCSISLEFLNPLSGDLLCNESLKRPGSPVICTLCMRRCWDRPVPLLGEGGGLLVYALGALSKALDAIKAAAFSILEETLGLVIGLLVSDGFKGSGGGALSGSELSHLKDRLVSVPVVSRTYSHGYRCSAITLRIRV